MSKTPAIAVRDLRFGWTPQHPVLQISQLDIERGERVFLAGSSGSGKSTLLSLLSGVVTSSPESVKVLGTDLAGLGSSQRDHFRANHLGLVFQLFNLIPYLSVLENVNLGTKFSSERAKKAKPGDAEALLGRLGMGDFLARKVTDLSVGQQQRVAVARALIGSPEIILADEPTSALDSDAKDAFLDVLLEESRRSESTVIFVSHDRSLSSHFDRTIELSEVNQAVTR